MELRSPDPACNPYLAFGLVLAAGLEGIRQKRPLPPPVNRNLFEQGAAGGLEPLPRSLAEALEAARASEFIARELPKSLAQNYFEGQERRIRRMAAGGAEAEREKARYFALT